MCLHWLENLWEVCHWQSEGEEKKWRVLKGFGIRRRGDPNPVPIWIKILLEVELNI